MGFLSAIFTLASVVLAGKLRLADDAWAKHQLRDVIKAIEAGVSPNAMDRPAKPGEFGVLKVSSVTWGEFRPDENKALFPDYSVAGIPTVRSGDLLLSRANTAELLAMPVQVPQDYPNLILSDKTFRLVLDEKRVAVRFLLYWLRQQTTRRYFASRATGTSGSMRNVSQVTIGECPIALPPLPVHRRIAGILDRAEALRAKPRAAIAKLDGLTQAIFRDLFGEPESNPRGWVRIRLGDLADVQGGLQLSASRKMGPKEVP
jgi:type I restriction enzyme, S subunit